MRWLRTLPFGFLLGLVVTTASAAGPSHPVREAPHPPRAHVERPAPRAAPERRIERTAAPKVERRIERGGERLVREPKVVVFDWDGTIGDTYPQLRWITERSAMEAGVAPSAKPGEDPYRTVIDGAGLEVMFRRLAPNGTHEQERVFIDRFNANTKLAPKELVRAKPGVLDDLRAFRTRHPGIKLAILSSRPQAVVEDFANIAGVSHLFDKIVGTGGSKIAEKPSPEGLHLITRELGVDAKDGVMIGDTPMDVGAGRAAGMHTVALTDGMGTTAKLNEAKPHVVLDRLPGWADRVLPAPVN